MADAPAATAATDTSAAKFESTDDIVSSLLADPSNADKSAKDEGSKDASEDVEASDGEDDAVEDRVESSDDSGDHEDDSATDDAAEIDDAAPVKGKVSGDLAAARKALDEGDLDKAFELAFGKKPEEVQPDAKVWTQWRAAQRKAEQRVTAREQEAIAKENRVVTWEQNARQQVQQTIEQLRPYDAHYQAAQAWQRDGDPGHLVKLIELTTGLPYDEAQKLILMKQRRTPGERQLAEQLAAIRKQLEEKTAREQQQTQTLTQQQIYANDLAIIKSKVAKVEGGEITKVPNYAERIYNVLVKTRTPQGLAMTEVEAARRVLAAERRKLETHPLLKRKEVSAAAATLAKAKKKSPSDGAPLRRNSQSNGAKDPKVAESTDDIIADLIKGHNPRAAAR